MSKWIPIGRDYPGDQMYDDVPGTEAISYWAEIGPTGVNDQWSWTIMATDDYANQFEADGGHTDTEDAAKSAVEAWRPEAKSLKSSVERTDYEPPSGCRWYIHTPQGEHYWAADWHRAMQIATEAAREAQMEALRRSVT